MWNCECFLGTVYFVVDMVSPNVAGIVVDMVSPNVGGRIEAQLNM
jgi:hypothetical protein